MQAILATDTPDGAKFWGRKPLKHFDNSDWKKVRLDVMVHCLKLKFGQNKQLCNFLVNTGSATIAEASPFDNVWGIGISEEDAIAGKQWAGDNLLGIALMIVRQHLVTEKLRLRNFDTVQLRIETLRNAHEESRAAAIRLGLWVGQNSLNCTGNDKNPSTALTTGKTTTQKSTVLKLNSTVGQQTGNFNQKTVTAGTDASKGTRQGFRTVSGTRGTAVRGSIDSPASSGSDIRASRYAQLQAEATAARAAGGTNTTDSGGREGNQIYSQPVTPSRDDLSIDQYRQDQCRHKEIAKDIL